MKYLLSLILFLSFSASANDWSGPVKVVEIIAGYKDGFVLFRTSGDIVNPNDCQDTYSLDPENSNVELALSLLLAAQRSDSEVEIGIDPSNCGRSGVQHLSGKIKVTRIRSL
ncbi:hypothetical protein P3339_18645 [Microbulbifer sp. MLAF003]|uniref:hypothetical protein n=1 Tax=Microbulbifer sp. MLAF003 TaxID=3032582 RepID=UPI0024ADC683|nr:hypothetical protein [Microbulbifer sp. MLAF003]WHI50438.1 hypothetical protein P3339_18645 [Microbulbifer sp. MLAF003]